MDKNWYENPSKSEFIGPCGGDEKTDDHAELTKVEHLNKKNYYSFCRKQWYILYMLNIA